MFCFIPVWLFHMQFEESWVLNVFVFVFFIFPINLSCLIAVSSFLHIRLLCVRLCLVLSCLVLSRLVLSCLVLSCLVLSCLVLLCIGPLCLVEVATMLGQSHVKTTLKPFAVTQSWKKANAIQDKTMQRQCQDKTILRPMPRQDNAKIRLRQNNLTTRRINATSGFERETKQYEATQ